ncbi:ferredoxin [Desulfosoma caldarium]|uniref:Ferredoxin n=1 Tax=Desulfosoma caldarium TaxID=610254 RepID=A0A3N1UNT0_9BACT|nr:ferredoxin [Desulfosoma caldarium]ROQ90137.1 ferredoxin [Desulfosoma caldarium]
MERRIALDEECCLGCETCVELCPHVFAMDSDKEKAYVLDEAAGDEACIEEAMASCPAECISWED